MSDYERGRADERADVAAVLRRKAREDGDEDFATTTEVWADVPDPVAFLRGEVVKVEARAMLAGDVLEVGGHG